MNSKNFNHYKFLIYLVNCAINEKKAETYFFDIDFDYLYKIAEETMFASVIYNVLLSSSNRSEISNETIKKFEDNYNKNLFKDINQQFELKSIIEFCEKNKIKNLPLKGSVLKYIFPRTDIRVMGDIDIWVEKDGIKKVKNYLKDNDYKLKNTNSYNSEYIKEPVMILELHNLITVSQNKDIFEYLNNTVIDNLINSDNYNYSYKMKIEDLYLHILEHCVKHYEIGGISIKMLTDFYILNKKYISKFNAEKISKLNKQIEVFGYTNINRTIVDLSYKWFSINGEGLCNDEFSNCIINNRSYGTLQNAIINSNYKKINLFHYTLRWLFPPVKRIKKLYYTALTKPYLVPFYYFVWWGERINIYLIKRQKNINHLKKVKKSIDSAKKRNQ